MNGDDSDLTTARETIYVTRPALPPLEEFIPYLEQIWENRILTNGGPFHQKLEAALGEYLGVPFVSLFNNGTNALITALQALELTGEVITTPFTFVATTHAIVWNGLAPVFVDIDSQTLNLDPKRIEAAITPKTSAILPVHCYGNPCDVDAIEEIAQRHHLKVIYDAAHAFEVKSHCGSLLNHGDLSVLSFHATKVFNTFEGGAIVCRDAEMKRRIDCLKNFGFENEVTISSVGTNGKMSEFNAALGLLQLKYVDQSIAARRDIDQFYRERLRAISGITCVNNVGQQSANYSYFPIIVGDGFPLSRDELYQRLRSEGIYARRYFYPLISNLERYRSIDSADSKHLKTANDVANRVVCLPIYDGLNRTDVERITSLFFDI